VESSAPFSDPPPASVVKHLAFKLQDVVFIEAMGVDLKTVEKSTEPVK
jgi:hypothetical protein